jgi:hypothetical protein
MHALCFDIFSRIITPHAYRHKHNYYAGYQEAWSAAGDEGRAAQRGKARAAVRAHFAHAVVTAAKALLKRGLITCKNGVSSFWRRRALTGVCEPTKRAHKGLVRPQAWNAGSASACEPAVVIRARQRQDFECTHIHVGENIPSLPGTVANASTTITCSNEGTHTASAGLSPPL